MLNLRRRTTPSSEIVLTDAKGVALARVPATVRQEMQYLWTRLEVHDGNVPRSVGLTSQLSGEGVSFVSRALAAVLARRGPTCLVEANWWGQGLPFSDVSEGLVGVLLGSSVIEQELIPTGQANLSVLPSGNLAASGGSVAFDNEAISSVLGWLHSHFAYTVLDLPALTTSSVGLSFTAAADASLLVVRQRMTRIDQIETAVEDLRHTRLLGVVLNRTHLSMPRFLQRQLLRES